MKFDFCIGNPPYQGEAVGDNTFAAPVYNLFMDAAYSIADKVELITPARFLFNAGSTPHPWNQQMLNDEHFKVLNYTADSSNVFSNTDIKGGVAIHYRDSTKTFGAIKTFTSFDELQSILSKVNSSSTESLDSIIYNQNNYNVAILLKEHPECKSELSSDGRDKRFRNNAFDRVSVFMENKFDNSFAVIGVIKNKRVWRYIKRKYVEREHENLFKYKVLVPAANGTGALGEVLSTPIIGTPNIAYTQTFIGIGAFDSSNEAEHCMKYIKTKFCRTMLSILKITQTNSKDTWRYVPLQDFTDSSDIIWKTSIKKIDYQLYKKYGLSKEEIDFIEAHVKEMV